MTVDWSPGQKERPEWERYETVLDTFVGELFTVVVLQSTEGDLFTQESLILLDTLSTEIKSLEGVSEVESLTTVKYVKGGKGFVRVEALVKPALLDAETLVRKKEDVFRDQMFVRNLISEDGRLATINVYVAPSHQEKSFRSRLLREIDKIITKQQDSKHEIFQLGTPLFQSIAQASIRKSLLFFTSLSVLVACVIIALYYRSTRRLVLSLLTISTSLLATLGFMAYMEYPLTSLTLVILLLMITFACTESGRLVGTYSNELSEGKEQIETLCHTVCHDGFPLLLTTLTLCLGLLVFTVSSSDSLQQFGIVSVFALVTSSLIALIFTLTLCRYAFQRQSREERPLLLLNLAGRIVEVCERYKVFIIGIILLLLIFALAGIFRLKIETTLRSPVKQQSIEISSALAGVSTFHVTIESGRENRIKEPEVLRQIDLLKNFIATQTWCDNARSFADYMKVVQREMQGGSKEMEVIPGSRELVSQYLLLLGNVNLQRYVNSDYSTANIIVRHHITHSQDIAAAVQAIRAYASKNVSNDLTVNVTGHEILVNQAMRGLLQDELIYFGFALLRSCFKSFF